MGKIKQELSQKKHDLREYKAFNEKRREETSKTCSREEIRELLRELQFRELIIEQREEDIKKLKKKIRKI